jgi:transcriptional regulator with XRE-family HTH domain
MDLNASEIREKRNKNGWTQQQLADISNLSLRTIQRVELNGVGSLETSKSLAVAFDVDRELLLVIPESKEARKKAYQQVPAYFLVLSFIFGVSVGVLALRIFN